MSDFTMKTLLATAAMTLRDVVCRGGCRHKSAEECAQATYMVFPYRGLFVRHLGRNEAVAEANQVVFFNGAEGYQISHPVTGGDASLSLTVAEPLLEELAAKEHLHKGAAFQPHRLRIDADTQMQVALVRNRLVRGQAEPLEAESLVIALVRRALGRGTSQAPRATAGRQKIVDRAKVVLASDPARRWTLGEVAGEVGVSPVYLTQLFRQVEGMPLYRYQLRLRLARALHLLGEYNDLAALGLELGFSSHSHFTAVFRQHYGCPPTDYQRNLHPRNC